MLSPMSSFEALTVTINVTEDCNLRCKYCYETCKTPKTLSLEHCKEFVDFIIDNFDSFPKDKEHPGLEEGIIWDFIGGDALMRVDLLEDVFKYITSKMANTDRFPRGYSFNICTNGTLFSSKRVRDFCTKWKPCLYINVSLDGCPEIHDLNRIFPNGKGTMAEIKKNWEWFKKEFPICALTTKATANKESIPYLYESLKYMHEELGLKFIPHNFIMEPMDLTQEDLITLEDQLMKCKDYLLEHRDELNWGMFEMEDSLNHKCEDDTPRCGSGWMPTLGIDGNVYPCFRWLPPSQNGETVMETKMTSPPDFSNFEKVQRGAQKSNCCPKECLECSYENFCGYCIAGGYAETGDFIRTTHICEITKIRAKVSKLYWEEYHATSR